MNNITQKQQKKIQVSKDELQEVSANIIDTFKKASHVQQAFVLAITLPKILREAQNSPEMLKVWTKADKIFKKMHAQTVKADDFRKLKSAELPAKAKRIEKLAVDLKIRYGTRHKTTFKDFYRICEGENIEIVTNRTKYNYSFSFTENGKAMNFLSLGTRKNLTVKSAYYLLGGLLIPSLYSYKKLRANKISDREFEVKSRESRYFSQLMRGEK